MFSARTSRFALALFCLIFVSTALGSNKLAAQSSVEVAPGDYVGSPNAQFTLPIQVSSNVAVTGFSFGVTHDGPISIESVRPSARLIAIAGGAPDSDFFVANTSPSGGNGFIVAVILPASRGDSIPAGDTHVMDATYSVEADAEGSATVSFTGDLSAEPGAPSVDLVVDVANGTARSFDPSSVEVDFVAGFLRGDADLSGSRSGNFGSALTVSDAVSTLQFLFSGGEPPACLDAADVDDSGVITLTDPLVTLNFLFRQGIRPAEPFPNPGLDPTPDDDLDCAGLGL